MKEAEIKFLWLVSCIVIVVIIIITLCLSKLSANMLSIFLSEKAAYIWTFIIVVILSSLDIFCLHASPIIAVFARSTLAKSYVVAVLLLILFSHGIMLVVVLLSSLALAVQDLLAPPCSRRIAWIWLIRSSCCLKDRRVLSFIFHMRLML